MRFIIVFIFILSYFNLSLSKEKIFRSMGTYLIVDTDKYQYDIYRYISNLESILSDYIEDSEISKINSLAGTSCVEVSSNTLEIIKKSIEISKLTEGAFDVTVGAVTINHKRKN